MAHLRGRIHDVGPMTVADYMREALTNPVGGYYMQGGKQVRASPAVAPMHFVPALLEHCQIQQSGLHSRFVQLAE